MIKRFSCRQLDTATSLALQYQVVYKRTLLSFQSKICKHVRKLLVIISNALDLVVGMITCRHIPGPPIFLVNVEKLGVAWGLGYIYYTSYWVIQTVLYTMQDIIWPSNGTATATLTTLYIHVMCVPETQSVLTEQLPLAVQLVGWPFEPKKLSTPRCLPLPL